MSYRATVDRTTLPAALLDAAKQHMRVDFDDDDATIVRSLQMAIGYLEIFWGQWIFAAVVEWSPPLDLGLSRYESPVRPVADFTVMVGTDDVSAGYRLESAGGLVAPYWLVRSDGQGFPNNAAIELKVGAATPDELEPAALGGILRVAATLYEHRESILSYSVDQVPWWINDVLGGLWVPRA
jgi:hypothetical protein